MRLGWMALPMLVAATACNPVKEYQDAARSLRFTLERVQPSLELAFPLNRSRVAFNVILGVDNPSTVPFRVFGFEGTLRMETTGKLQPLGQVGMGQPLDLPAGGRAELPVVLSFTYQDLADRWPELQAVLHGEAAGSWELKGVLHAEVHGLPLQLPVRTRRSFGTATAP